MSVTRSCQEVGRGSRKDPLERQALPADQKRARRGHDARESSQTVSALATLERRGLILRMRRAGRDEFEPDKQSVYYPMTYGTALVDLPLTEALHGQSVYAVFAYGSLAEPGSGTRSSDLDLFIVGDVKDRALMMNRLAMVGERLGRMIDPFILSPE